MFLFHFTFFIYFIDAEDFAYPWQNIFEHPVRIIYMQDNFKMILKESFLYEHVDDHLDRSIHDTDDLKSAIQNIMHTGDNDNGP